MILFIISHNLLFQAGQPLLPVVITHNNHADLSYTPANTKEKIALNLMRIFKEGPEVSFRGSPTVSPITAALCSSVPLPLIISSNNLY